MANFMHSNARHSAALALLLLAACGGDAVTNDPIGIDDDVADATVDNDTPESDAPGADVADDGGDDDTAQPDADSDVEPDTIEPDTIEPDVTIRCSSNDECDDGLSCTTDVCDTEAGVCTWAVAAQKCLVRGQCYNNGELDPGDPCLACAPSVDPLAFSARDEGASCDDGNACTVGETCTDGVCAGEALSCNDGNACTDDLCDVELGCIVEDVADGISCDDGTLCTEDDACLAGTCVGEVAVCDDGDPCTDNTCGAETGCVFMAHTRACDDLDACTVADSCSEDGTCGGRAANCDDGNACTIDVCDEFAGCQHLPTLNPCCQGSVSICDDGNPCTTDLCDPETAGCDYVFNTASCNDGNACTAFDTCSEGECAGETRDCNDNNDCTEDFCRPATGCEYSARNSGSCEDGIDCTLNDSCVEGECVAGVSECVCEPGFGLDAVKLTAIAIGPDGRAGNGLDLDQNPATCSPRGSCENGIDNALSVAASFANEPLGESLADGSLILTIDLDNIALNPFTASVFTAELAPTNADCDVQAAACDYQIDASTLDSITCESLVSLPATRAGNRIFAGGPNTIFPFDIPIGDGVLSLTLYAVRLEGAITLDGDRVATFAGVLGGAVRKTDLLAAIDALPADSLPLDPAAIRDLINLLVTNDIDVDGDGTPDAASIGLPLSGIRAQLVGVSR